MSDDNPRDHGYGDSPEPVGAPVVIQREKAMRCPHCGCGSVYSIEVPVRAPRALRVPPNHEAVTRYVGCPACPWASPAITTSRPKPDPKN